MPTLGPLRLSQGTRDLPMGPPLGPDALRFQRARTADAMFLLQGISRDSTGAVLGGCTVDLFYSGGDKQRYGSTASDAVTGAYTFVGGDRSSLFFAVFYKAGSPDVAGTTKNNLTFV